MSMNKEWLEKCHSEALEKFRNFKADINLFGSLITIDWRNEDGSSDWYVRYILDGTNLIITGDLGYAVFRRAEPYTLRYCKKMLKDLAYNAGKCRAVDPETGIYCYPERLVKEALEEYFADYLSDDPDEMLTAKISELKESLLEANNYHTGISFDTELDMALSEIDPDAWEWVTSCGRQYTQFYIAWLVGLRLSIIQYASRFVDDCCTAACLSNCSTDVWTCPKFESYLKKCDSERGRI